MPDKDLNMLKDNNSRWLKAELAAGVMLTLVILSLHVSFMLNAGAFWRDEVHSIQLAMMPSLSSVWAAMEFDSFPILSSLLIRLWSDTGWGGTDAGLRFLGLLVGAGIVLALWFNARLIGRSVPLVSLLLFGFSSLTIRFGDSIRPYGIGILLITLTLGLIWSVVESPSPRKVFAAALAAVLSVHCLYTNAVLLFAICLGGLAVASYNRMWKRAALVLGIGIAAALSLLPYLGMIRKSSDWVELVKFPNSFAMSWEVLSKATLGSASRIVLWVWSVLFLLGLALAAYRFFIQPKASVPLKEKNLTLFFATVMLASAAGFFIFFKIMEVPPSAWYFLTPMAIVAVSLDALWGESRKTWAACRIALAILIVGLTLGPILQKVKLRQTNVDLIAAELGQLASKDDLILVSPWFNGITFQRYYKGETPWMTIPPVEDLQVHRYDILKKKIALSDPLQDVFDRIDSALAGGGKLWLVGNFYTAYRPQTGQLPVMLPPAPNGPFGWKNEPYLQSMAMQTEYFIYSKGAELKRLANTRDKQPVDPNEKYSVVVVNGRLQE